jgi:GH24 family phage-related lysozyme (muramidase)
MTTIQQVIDKRLLIIIATADSEILKEIQSKLKTLGYYSGDVDGLYGPQTEKAWADFKKFNWQYNPETIGESSATLLLNAKPKPVIVPRQAIDLIKEFEGYFSEAYPDDIAGWDIPTIGWGTIKYPNGKHVQRGDICTKEEATQWLLWEVNDLCTPALTKIPTWKQMNDNQKSALYSFAYNLGADFYGRDGFQSITTLVAAPRRWGDINDVSSVFALYRNPGTDAEVGLKRRRIAEATLFCKPI